jgi:molecular chaperone DnaK (HSP70)
LGIEPVKVVADFLSRVREVTWTSIENTYSGIKLPYEYVLTVPAIWSDSAKNLMAQAAASAGYGTHHKDFNLISEPEAAAAYTLSIEQHGLEVRWDSWIDNSILTPNRLVKLWLFAMRAVAR